MNAKYHISTHISEYTCFDMKLLIVVVLALLVITVKAAPVPEPQRGLLAAIQAAQKAALAAEKKRQVELKAKAQKAKADQFLGNV
ncbi:hypothetical protein EX30DRAFT_370810 [Ascodesmis nigricans]|uniref:Uncharacterized protein n=1 Tax=Ascodesmis nigricans TaxID=341454 RepID=A0A4S2MZR2_9PEZI|nr:hypothetical protein EX30DRAFT_370810 [Ascodesmis nigricans]